MTEKPPIRRPLVRRPQDWVPLTDESWMPFGKYRQGGEDPRKLGKVPGTYLLWLRHEEFLFKYPALLDWIEKKFAEPETEPPKAKKQAEAVNVNWKADLEKMKREL